MAIAPILLWLSDTNRTYHHGKLLYEQYGRDLVTRTIINTGHQGSSYHFITLENALRELSSSFSEVKAVVIPDLSTFDKPLFPSGGLTNEEYAKLPEDLKNVRGDARQCFQRAQFLFARIPLTDSPGQRLTMALQLLDDWDENRRLMGEVQHFMDNGSVIEKAPAIEKLKQVDQLSTKELMAESKNIPTYITKDRKKLASATEASKSDAINIRLNGRLERLEQINKRLNA